MDGKPGLGEKREGGFLEAAGGQADAEQWQVGHGWFAAAGGGAFLRRGRRGWRGKKSGAPPSGKGQLRDAGFIELAQPFGDHAVELRLRGFGERACEPPPPAPARAAMPLSLAAWAAEKKQA